MKKLNEYVLREMADEYILIPVGSSADQFNGIMTLTETAVFIYEHIEDAESFEKLIDMIVNEYEIDRETASQDAEFFINQMLYVGIIGLSDEKLNW